MQDFSFVTTVTRVPESVVTGITDLDIGPSMTLYATSRSAGVTSEFALSSTGSASFDADTNLPAEIAQIEIIEIDGQPYALAIGPGLADQILWPIGANGSFGAAFSLPTDAGAVAGFRDIAGLAIDGTTFVYGIGYTDVGLYAFQVNSPTTPPANAQSNLAPPVLDGVSQVDAAEVGGAKMLLTVSADGRTLSSYLVAANGSLTFGDSTGAADGLGVAGITEVRHVSLPDGDYLVAAARDSSSLSVIAIEADGSLTPVDHITDDLGTRFQNVTALATEKIGDRVIIAAGGADDGVSLFELLPGGRLHHRQTLVDDADRALANIGALALEETADVLNLYAGSATETGISHFNLSTSDWTVTWIGDGGEDSVSGDAQDQVLWGRAGDDWIDGGDGADVLMDGSGNDTLTGGAGADYFVMSNDGDTDTIADFTVGEDTIDLSGWTFLRNASQITFTATAQGGRIAYGDDVLEIISQNAQPLTEAGILIDGTFNVTRFPVGNPSQGNDITGTTNAEALVGGPEDNVIEGLAGNDTLRGGAGDDVLAGGLGADLLDGGVGEDTVSFSDATQGLRIDLLSASANTGEASGDVFIDVEHIEGTAFDDNLRGSDLGNRIKAGSGNDLVFGRQGNDTLVGDGGADTLIGGTGGDTIDGGQGIDRVAYWTASGAVRADLQTVANNTGEAAGDSYASIENLQGSDFNDDLRGDGFANHIWGGKGRDQIAGRDGDDTLDGGDGDDLLIGGAGADLMIGGAGRDRAAYWTSTSAIVADLFYAEFGTGDATGDTFTSVEDLQGTNFNDNLRGDMAGNSIWGGTGIDTIYGRGGNDILYGQDGNDVLLGGTGGDVLNGGAGIDRAAYWTAASGVRVDFFSPGNSTGEAAGDTFTDIEDLQGTAFADDLRGDNASNRIYGGAQDDVLHGRGGADELYGQGGNDTLLAGSGADRIDGGTGIDRAAYWTSSAGVTASLASPASNTGDAAGDVYIDIEHLQGTNFNDDLEGDASANTLFGGSGNDTLAGGLGNDELRGGAGADEFIFLSGNDSVTDYAAGEALVFDLAPASGLDAQDILNSAQASGGGTLIDYGAGTVFLDATAPGTLSLGDINVI
ncbi:MAG: calcium-binding protein [Pseudomonadota bacterium]